MPTRPLPRLGAALATVLSLLTACGGSDDYYLIDDLSPALITMDDEGVAAACPGGGRRVVAGVDADGDGRLGAGEIGSTQYVCNGDAGPAGSAGLNTLARTIDEPPGARCATGGRAVEVGLDLDRNGKLDDTEITATALICNGNNGSNGSNGSNGQDGAPGLPGTPGRDGTNGRDGLNALAVSDDVVGNHCANGGARLRTGQDADNDGVLDDAEVSSTRYLCDPADPLLSWVEVFADVQAEPNKGYVARNADAPVVVTLPSSPAVGDVVRVSGSGAGGWTVAQSAGQVIHTGALGDTWRNGGVGNWTAVASSDDGLSLVGVEAFTSLYTSSDGGRTLTSNTEAQPGETFEAVASSADGNTLVVAVNQGAIKISTNAGATWAATNSDERRWRDVAVSADGSRIVAVFNDTAFPGLGGIYTSTDGGGQWTDRHVDGAWTSVASSADGNRLIASTGGPNGQLFVSTNGGGRWSSRTPAGDWDWRDVASSADGIRLAAVTTTGRIFISRNGGLNWTSFTLDSQPAWMSLAMSADGRRLAVVGRDTPVYLSADGGLTWRSSGDRQPRWSVAMSSSADRIFAPYNPPPGGDSGSIQYLLATTTPGPTGGLDGEAFDAVELQYIGDGHFNVLSHAGGVVVR